MRLAAQTCLAGPSSAISCCSSSAATTGEVVQCNQALVIPLKTCLLVESQLVDQLPQLRHVLACFEEALIVAARQHQAAGLLLLEAIGAREPRVEPRQRPDGQLDVLHAAQHVHGGVA